jgi:hypothetical protein
MWSIPHSLAQAPTIVRFAYSPAVVWIGLGVSLLSALALFFAWHYKAPKFALILLAMASLVGLVAAFVLPLVDVVTVYSSGEADDTGGP